MLIDTIINAFKNLCAKPAKTLLTMCATIIAVACLVGISGVTATASGQIATNFNELQAIHITVTDIATKNSDDAGFNFPENATEKIGNLNGVEHSGVYYTIQDSSEDKTNTPTIDKLPKVQLSKPTGTTISLMGVGDGFLQAINSEVKMVSSLMNFIKKSKQK